MNLKYLTLYTFSVLSLNSSNAAEVEKSYVGLDSVYQMPHATHLLKLDDESYHLIMDRLQAQEVTTNFDYSDSRVSDIKCTGTRYIDDVLLEIIGKISALTLNKPIQFDFTDNYLQDEGLEKVKNVVLESDYIKRNITVLNLRNNRLSENSLEVIKELLTLCKKLTIDISINNIELSKINEYFASTADINGRLKRGVF